MLLDLMKENVCIAFRGNRTVTSTTVTEAAMMSSSSASTQSPPPCAESEARDFAFFDKVYNKRGKVQIIPDIKKPTAQYLKKAQKGKRTDSAKQKEKETQEFVLDEGNFQSRSVLSHEKSDEAEYEVLRQLKAALEKDMKPDLPPVFVLHNQFLEGTTVTGQSQEARKTDKSQEAARTDKSQEAVKCDESQEAGKTGKSQEAGKTGKSQEAGKTDKSQEEDKTDKSQEAVKTDKSQEADKTDKSQEAVKTDESQEAGKTDKSQEAVKTDKSQKAGKTSKSQEAGKTGKSQEAGKTGKSQEAGKTGKSQEAGKTDKSQKVGKTGKSQEAGKTGQSEKEKDVLVLHPTLGVLFLEVKGISPKEFDEYFVKATENFSVFDKATEQLLHAQTCIQKEMGDQLGKDAVILTIALPNLRPEDASVIREKLEERMKQKQTSDVTEGTTSTEGKPVMTSVTGTAEQAAIASSVRDSRPDGNLSSPPPTAPPSSPSTRGSRKIEKFLVDHPEILLLCGSTDEVYGQWVKQLEERRASSDLAFQGISDEEREKNFKRACIRRFSVARLRPGQSVKDSAALHRRFLLSEEQLRVRDSQAQLLHIWGPPGSGKTLLLAERARRWVSENKRVALAVGEIWHGALLHLLACSVCVDITDTARVSAHRSYGDLLEWLHTVSTEEPVYVIIDEAWSVNSSSLLKHVRARRVRGLWAASTRRLDDRDKEALQELGGTKEQLEISFRCPPSVSTASNAVRNERWEPPLLPPPVPLVRELGEKVVIISHPDHPQSQPWDKCPTCKKEVEAFFSSLGLPGDSATSALSLSDCVVITTNEGCDRERVAAWLQGLGLHAMADKMSHVDDVTPVLLPGETPKSRDEAEMEARMSRLSTGTDRGGKPVLHVVHFADFRGLERAVVMVWHENREDGDRDRQGQEDRDLRMFQHCCSWFTAMTRSLARVAVMATTHSPLLRRVQEGELSRGPAGSR